VAGSLEAFRDALAPKQPMKRVGQQEEVAEAILWLAGSTSSLVTGHALIVDGGAAAQQRECVRWTGAGRLPPRPGKMTRS